jgi:hypothetical protein
MKVLSVESNGKASKVRLTLSIHMNFLGGNLTNHASRSAARGHEDSDATHQEDAGCEYMIHTNYLGIFRRRDT